MKEPHSQEERPPRHGVPWSDNELDVLDRAIRAGWTWAQIADRFQRKPDAVQRKAMSQAFELYYQRPVGLSDSGPDDATATGADDERRTA